MVLILLVRFQVQSMDEKFLVFSKLWIHLLCNCVTILLIVWRKGSYVNHHTNYFKFQFVMETYGSLHVLHCKSVASFCVDVEQKKLDSVLASLSSIFVSFNLLCACFTKLQRDCLFTFGCLVAFDVV
jgi:hypothetical protein